MGLRWGRRSRQFLRVLSSALGGGAAVVVVAVAAALRAWVCEVLCTPRANGLSGRSWHIC
eukprot:4218356-Amphidinium_carterae.2